MHIFTRLPVIATTPGLAQLNRATDFAPLIPFDARLYDHWQFGGNNASLIGKKDGQVLTPQSTVTYPVGNNYITIGTAAGQALQTALSETSTQIRTVCAVVRDTNATGLRALFGTFGAGGEGGGSLFVSGTAPSKSVFSSFTGITSTVNQGAIVQNAWTFVALSIDFSGGTREHKALIGGGAGVSLSSAGVYTAPVPSTRKLSLGSSYGTFSTAGSTDVAELMVYDGSALTLAELQALYLERKTKLVARGIAVV